VMVELYDVLGPTLWRIASYVERGVVGDPWLFSRRAERSFFGLPDTFQRWSECVYCLRPAEVIDHMIPRCQGGTNDSVNLAPSCWNCNSTKSGRTPLQWFADLGLPA